MSRERGIPHFGGKPRRSSSPISISELPHFPSYLTTSTLINCDQQIFWIWPPQSHSALPYLFPSSKHSYLVPLGSQFHPTSTLRLWPALAGRPSISASPQYRQSGQPSNYWHTIQPTTPKPIRMRVGNNFAHLVRRMVWLHIEGSGHLATRLFSLSVGANNFRRVVAQLPRYLPLSIHIASRSYTNTSKLS